VLGRGGALPAASRRHEPVAPGTAPGADVIPPGAWPQVTTAGPAAGAPVFPDGLTSRRPDAWELPAVEPRTRPGRTG